MRNSIGWKEMEDLLIKLGDALETPTELVVIGSTVCMSMGQPDRMTMDIDVWRRDSAFDLGMLKKACAAVGISFDPKGYDEPDSVYLQMVEPGIVQLGKFSDTSLLFKTGNLEIRHPPPENVIASKLVRGAAWDFDDCVFLVKKCKVSAAAILQAVKSIEDLMAQEAAIENITMLNTCIDLGVGTDMASLSPNERRANNTPGMSF